MASFGTWTRRVKVYDYRQAPCVGQGLVWAIFGPFGKMRVSGFALNLRQAKRDALKAESELVTL